jgi:hypothetical protein
VTGSSTASANTNLKAGHPLSTGTTPITWNCIGWNLVGWNSDFWERYSGCVAITQGKRKTKLKYSEKTIPYRLSPAELENLRILRRRTQPSNSMQDTEKVKRASEETDACTSDPDQTEKKPVGKPS